MTMGHGLLTVGGLAAAAAMVTAAIRWMHADEPEFQRPHRQCWPSLLGSVGLGACLVYILVLQGTLHGVTDEANQWAAQAKIQQVAWDRQIADTEARYVFAISEVTALQASVDTLTSQMAQAQADLSRLDGQITRYLAMASPEQRTILQVADQVAAVRQELRDRLATLEAKSAAPR